MDNFRTRVVRVMRAGWGIFGLGLAAGIATPLLGGSHELPLAVGLVAVSIFIAFALNLLLLAILLRRGKRGHESVPVPIAADAPPYEQPASM